MKNCITCGASFASSKYNQIYCGAKCRELFKKRRQRLVRQNAGLCPQCGGPMDYPVRIGRGKAIGKTKISYCSTCRKRFKKNAIIC